MNIEPRTARLHSRNLWRGFDLAAVALGLCACSGGVVDVGENQDPAALPPNSRCLASDTIDGPIAVQNQDQLEQLAGCATIRGDLVIVSYPGTDLRPLRSLTTVEGVLALMRAHSGWPGIDIDRTVEPVEGEWLTSLAGLERLDSVGGLLLDGISATTFAPLASLRRVGEGIDLMRCPEVRDLRGLEQVQPMPSFSAVECAELRDI